MDNEKMINKYLAKSNPKETIQEHTDKLLKNYEILKKLYPNLFLNWDISYMLELVCLYHDLGKMNLEFQQMIIGNIRKQRVPHGLYSACLLDGDSLCDEMEEKYKKEGYSNKEAEEKAIDFVRIVTNSIVYHHEREITKETEEFFLNSLSSLEEQLEGFEYEKIEKELSVIEIAPDFFTFGSRILPGEKGSKDSQIFDKFTLVKGLLNRIDYSASAGIDVERENNFLLKSLDKMLEEWKKYNPNVEWNELQKYMIKNRDKNLITIAQTGMGKTEAGLLWIGDTKGFFILPLKTAINAIYERITKGIVKENIDEKVGLLHSETREVYLEEFSTNKNIDEYYERTKQLSLPLTICTLDQIFDFVYRYKGFEPKLATMAYSKIVLDEIQMYSPDLLGYVIRGLGHITRLGGKFAIVTATFPKLIEDLLKEEGIDFEVSPNFTKSDLSLRHSVEVKESCIDTDFILSKFDRNKVLVICNSVKEAQRVYGELFEKLEDKSQVNLFHSKYIKRDRRKKEEQILKIGNKNSKDYGIWVATQVVEASLDIDFDILITELSDLNGLLQRMGRCYRNRPLHSGIVNCYVYVGDEKKKNSGVGFVIDKDIYNYSRELVLTKMNGEISEDEKMKYVEELYTTENLKNTEYYKKVRATLKYLELVSPYEKTKQETQEEFRDITTYAIIPKNIYDENREEIEENLDIINSEIYGEDREKIRNKKLLAKIGIRDLTMSIQAYELKKGAKLSNLEKVKLGKYEDIYILDCNYGFEKGFELKEGVVKDIIEFNFL